MKKIATKLLLIFSLTLCTACVYFNTFYNAKNYFSEAEKLRLNRKTESIGNNITNKYKKVIEKADVVINHHPNSRYVDDALFLKGKSHYYRREYEQAKESFVSLLAVNRQDYIIESEYWLALIKWKLGSPRTALSDLEQLEQNVRNKTLLAEIAQAQAEILLDLDQDSLAVPALVKAANFMKNRREKAQLYQRLAELAYKINDYENSIKYYENVIKYSISNQQTMAANLEIVKRYRDLDDLEKASSEIQRMLADPEFSTIHDKLELEFAKLKLSQNNIENAVESFTEITVNYPRTEAAGEAFYHLGERSLLDLRDFEKAEFYYKQIKKESPQSGFLNMGNQRINELNKFKKAMNIVKKLDAQFAKNDSLQKMSAPTKIDTSQYVTALYNLGELEAFHFEQTDTALIYFNRIASDFQSSELISKALFVLSYLYNDSGDSIRSKEYGKSIVQNYPDSEYAEYIRENSGISDYSISGFDLLLSAEQLHLTDKSAAMQDYYKIANLKESEAALRALYFLAYQYENYYFNSDSTKKYYNQIISRFPQSEQAEIARTKLQHLEMAKTNNAPQKSR